MGLEKLNAAFLNVGVSCEEASNAVNAVTRLLPPFTETDIQSIKNNPSLSFWQKIKIIRKMKKYNSRE